MSDSRATNMSGVSNSPRARFTSAPSPVSPPTNSPTTAPMTDRVTPVRKPPNRMGSEAGSSSLMNTCQGEAFRLRMSSRLSASTLRRATTMLTRMGKKTTRAHTMTLLSRPWPNQSTSRGARATTGTDCDATM